MTPAPKTTSRSTTVVIPNWNGRRWLEGLFGSLAEQTLAPAHVVVVDNGSTDGSPELIERLWPAATVERWPDNRGFAAAANRGFELAATEFVALVNTDIELDPDWIERSESRLMRELSAASVATKMVDLADPTRIYDTGDFLRRDGATEQRGRFRADTGRFDQPGEVWSACAGAALYRRSAVIEAGAFDEFLGTYLEDVELGLRLRLAGWSCVYEPCVARHASGGSEAGLTGGATRWVERNTLIIVARHFPARWLGRVAYRQVAWAAHHARSGTIVPWLKGLAAGLAALPSAVRARRSSPPTKVTIEAAIPNRPWRGRNAGGHRLSAE